MLERGMGPKACHCEERSDDAISVDQRGDCRGPAGLAMTGLVLPLACSIDNFQIKVELGRREFSLFVTGAALRFDTVEIILRHVARHVNAAEA